MKLNDGLYCGTMGWTNSNDTDFDNFIIRNFTKEFSVDIKYKDEKGVYEYTITLSRAANDLVYRGKWRAKDSEGEVRCNLFYYGDEILLFGNWMEGNNKPLTWWVTLSEC
ncbi:MAG: hypothetical protein ACH34X_17915 [Thiolinea sp.]